MSKRAQVLVSVLLVGASVITVVLFTRSGSSQGGAESSMGGHDMSAMGGGGGDELNPVALSSDAARRIGVTYATAELRRLDRTLQTVGMVAYDETLLADVSPKIEGWAEELHVDFTGAVVQEGQPLLDVYSPVLVSAQEELLLARRLVDGTESQPESRAAIKAQDLLASARRRLDYWDVPADEIERIETQGVVTKTITFRSPASGIVVEKNIVQGGRFMPGTQLYRIADLSRVWVEAEIFEKDLSLLRLGQRARVSFEAYPGKSLSAVVTYVYPTVRMEARTGRIRLELDNRDLSLRPGMYARVEFPLPASESRLVVPRSSVLTTGDRSVVFVSEHGMLMPREVVTGLLNGEGVEILSGLEPGEVVVSSATFLIDAESNLSSAMDAMAGMEGIGDSLTSDIDSGGHDPVGMERDMNMDGGAPQGEAHETPDMGKGN